MFLNKNLYDVVFAKHPHPLLQRNNYAIIVLFAAFFITYRSYFKKEVYEIQQTSGWEVPKKINTRKKLSSLITAVENFKVIAPSPEWAKYRQA